MCVSVCVCMYVCVCVCMCMYVCVCMCVYIYIYIYIYTHTHIYIYITQDNKAFLADSKNRQEFLYYLLRLMMNNYSPKMRVWVAAGNTKSGWCTAIELNYIVIEQDCKRILHPFICETGKRMFVVF